MSSRQWLIQVVLCLARVRYCIQKGIHVDATGRAVAKEQIRETVGIPFVGMIGSSFSWRCAELFLIIWPVQPQLS
jgi:hypothetical protein